MYEHDRFPDTCYQPKDVREYNDCTDAQLTVAGVILDLAPMFGATAETITTSDIKSIVKMILDMEEATVALFDPLILENLDANSTDDLIARRYRSIFTFGYVD